MKRLVEVFPDYCSTGLWLVDLDDPHPIEELRQEGVFGRHVNIDPTEVGVSPGLQIALKYWHELWEFNIACTWTEEECKEQKHKHMSKKYEDRWIEDGKKLAKLLSAENDKYEFVYKE